MPLPDVEVHLKCAGYTKKKSADPSNRSDEVAETHVYMGTKRLRSKTSNLLTIGHLSLA